MRATIVCLLACSGHFSANAMTTELEKKVSQDLLKPGVGTNNTDSDNWRVLRMVGEIAAGIAIQSYRPPDSLFVSPRPVPIFRRSNDLELDWNK